MHKVQPKSSAWKIFLKTLGHSSLSSLNSQPWLRVVSLSWYAMWDKFSEILHSYPVLILINFLFMYILSPEALAATVYITFKLLHLFIFTECVSYYFQSLNKFLVADQTHAVCYQ